MVNVEKVAYDIAKIYIWKQITTSDKIAQYLQKLLMILQRYTFGSKSQHMGFCLLASPSCLWYCKDIHLEANHNCDSIIVKGIAVAYDIAKIYIWKQITTESEKRSKLEGCLWYCKDIHLEANHNQRYYRRGKTNVAYDIAKIYIWKQITTWCVDRIYDSELLMILQRYTFGSKSQR